MKGDERMEEELHKAFIYSGYSALCTHSIETAVLSSRKIVLSQF